MAKMAKYQKKILKGHNFNNVAHDLRLFAKRNHKVAMINKIVILKQPSNNKKGKYRIYYETKKRLAK